MVTSGYSGTPLVNKLGIKKGFDVLFVDVPAHYLNLLIDLPNIQIMKSQKRKQLISYIYFALRYLILRRSHLN